MPAFAAASRGQQASQRCGDFTTVLPGHLPAAADAKDPTVVVQNINTSVGHFEEAAAQFVCAATAARDHARTRRRVMHQHRRLQRLQKTRAGPFVLLSLCTCRLHSKRYNILHIIMHAPDAMAHG